jgi:hypothetical protein
MSGQPLVSLADIQWVLHTSPSETRIPVRASRRGKMFDTAIDLEGNWKASDIAWRASSWYGLRQGVKVEPLTGADKRARSIAESDLALVVKTLAGRGGPKVQQAGLRAGDVIVAVDGSREAMTETDFLVRLRVGHRPGDSVKLTVLRAESQHELTIPMW